MSSNSKIPSDFNIPAAESSHGLTQQPEPGSVSNWELHQQVKLLRLLNSINYEIHRTLDLQEILNSACEMLGKTLKCDRVSVLVKDPEENVFITKGEYCQPEYPSQLAFKVPENGNPHLQALMKQESPLAVERMHEFPGLSQQALATINTLQIQSMLAVATRYQGQVNGIIGLHQCDRPRQWQQWEEELLAEVASSLAIAINQAQLYAETQRQAKSESLVRLITNQIRSSLDLETILQTTVEGVRQLLNTDRVVVYQFGEDWNGSVVVEDVIEPWDSVLGNMGADDCFSEKYAYLYQNGRVRAIDNIREAGLDDCHVQFLEKLQVKANLIVPIVMGKNLWGLLIAHECSQPRSWRTYEINLLTQLGEQIAIAINQAELFQQVQVTAKKYQEKAQQLEKTLQKLRSTQNQLIQSEKLSSLGEMVAGISHEINNANNFIQANIPYAQEYANILIQALESCAQIPEAADQVAEITEDIELAYLQDDFPNLIDSMKQGAERISSIINALRTFSRLDEAQVKTIDIHEAIESSLAVLHHRIGPSIQIHKNYSELPRIRCFPSHLNQVFYNLLNNAFDAIVAQKSIGEITIRSWQIDGDWIGVAIRDNGIGIDAETQNKIFDPFFTNKPVGKGTGLGLSTCYQVVVQGHGGKLSCHSELGKGAEFVVELPVQSKVLEPRGQKELQEQQEQ
ncbi:GAF domain-containing protein [Geitlerinema sp. PCC 9228]|jgi:signal transduction histidine kinase|uniref:GAF domain-containing sensor histidine kinase n=1 Tax=Geitlerinema sp. PCC 9228 TaxID=111611 RepID=UPI000A052115|nr:GAF domain-containing protein [Geitlerinema sp. PCC 9228]